MTKALYIRGEWITGYGPVLSSHNPYTLEKVWSGNSASVSDVHRALQAARLAFFHWRALPLEKRIDYLKTYKEKVKEKGEALALAISQEMGKPLRESRAEVELMQNKVDISIRAYQERCPHTIVKEENVTIETRYHPHGVLAVLGPFNFPAHLPNGHIVPALLAGNTVVFKPSEFTPLVGEIMTRCWQEASLPQGVFNLVQGDSLIGKELSKGDINGLLFTGSFNTGVSLTKQFAETPGKILALEMGGNNPLVVTHTKDPERTADAIINSAYGTTGQRCTSARRLILKRGEHGNEILSLLLKKIPPLTIGPYTDSPEPFMGPLVNEPAAVKVIMHQGLLEARGATPLIRSTLLKDKTGLISPGLIDVTKIEEKPDIEIFGPFLQLIWVDSLKEGIEEANKTAYGLSAALFSDDPTEWNLFSSQVKAGIINWNRPTTGARSDAPFGGIGKSGNNRPSAYLAADYCSYPIVSLIHD